MFKKRIDEPLTKAIDQGKKFFFLYGEGIKDLYLEDMFRGVLSLKDTLKYYFFYREDCEIFAFINTDGVQVFRKKDSALMDITESYLTLGSKEDSEMPDDDEEGGEVTSPKISKSNAEEVKQLKEKMESGGINILNYIGIIKMKSQDKNVSAKRTVVFFEDFEWLGKLYSSSNADSLEYIKALKDFYKIEECYTLVSMEDIELIQKYNFETKGSNAIFLGNPSSDEIKYAYLRSFLGKTDFRRENIQLDLFEQLNNISQALSASKKSLMGINFAVPFLTQGLA